MEGIDLGGATLRLYGDRTALDRELAILERYTKRLEQQGIKVKFDADTGRATREVDELSRGLHGVAELLDELGRAAQGDFGSLAAGLGQAGAAAAGTTGALGGAAGAMGGLASGALKALPILGQLGMAAMGVQAIFQGLGAAIGAALAPLERFSHEADRFNQQVAKGSIFAARSYSVTSPDGDVVEKTSDQMRALRPVIGREFEAIHREVAHISGATAAEIQEGFNIILQNSQGLGTAADDISNIRNLAVRTAAAMNTLGIPAQQLRSELMSLMTGNVQMYDELGKSLGYTSERIKNLQAQGGTAFYDELIRDLETLYEGQKVMAESLSNVKSNYQEFFETVGAQGGQRLEAGFAGGLNSILNQLQNLEKSWTTLFSSISTALEPVLRVLGQVGAILVPIGSAIGSIFSMFMTGISPILSILGSVMTPGLEILAGIFGLIAKLLEVNAANFSKLMQPINAMFSAFGDGDTDIIRDFFTFLGDQLENAAGFADSLLTKLTAFLRKVVELRAQTQANFVRVQDPKTGQYRGLTEQEKQEFVGERLANYDRRAAYDAGFGISNKMLDQESKDFFEEVSAKNQGWGGRNGSISQRDLARAQELAQVRKAMWDNDIKALEQGLRLMAAQKSLVQAMTELTENRRKLDAARAGFAVQLASSPEVRANAEIAQRELLARQEADRLQERREVLGVERQIQQRQAEIQMKQAQMQTVQLEIMRMEAQINRDKAAAAIKAQEDLLPKLTKAERIIAENRLRDARIELAHREAILGQAGRAVSLAQENEGIVGTIAGIEQQRLGIQEQQLDVMAQQNRLSAEQAQLLDSITAREQALKREYEQLSIEAAKVKADRESEIEGSERQLTLLGEQVKLQKVLADQAKVASDQEVEAANRALEIARGRETAEAPGAGIRDIIGAEVQALAAGEAGLTSVADATKRLYDARERQLLQEQELARTQQRLQQEREQSEMRIAALRLKVQEFELKTQIAQEGIRGRQAQVQVERDNLSSSLQVSVNAAGGDGAAPQRAELLDRFGVIAQSQLDNASGQGWRECLTTVSAMVASGSLGRHVGDDQYNAIRRKYGDSPSHAAQLGALKEMGVNATMTTTARYSDLQSAFKQGRSIGVGVTSSIASGHWWYVAEVTDTYVDIFEPNSNPPKRQRIPRKQFEARFNPGGSGGYMLSAPGRGNVGGPPPAPVLPPAPGARTQAPAAPTGSSASLPTGGTLTAEQLYRVNLAAGFTASEAQRMTAIQLAESGGRSRALRNQGRDLSYGISQINMLGTLGPARRQQFGISSNEELYDPLTNARAARMVYQERGSWAPWSVTRNGAITPAMERAAAAAAQTVGAAPGQAAGPVPLSVVPATTGQQQLDASTQRVEILEQSLANLSETIKQFDTLLSNLTQRQGMETQTLAMQQQGAIGNLRMDRTEAMVIQQTLGSRKAQFMADVADTYGGWMSGAIKGALQQIRQTGELDLAAFGQEIMGGLLDRMIEMGTDYLMGPIEAAMKKSLFGGLTGIDDEKLKELVRQEQAAQGQQDAATRMGAAVDRFGAKVDGMGATGGLESGGTPPAAAVEVLPGAAAAGGLYDTYRNAFPNSQGGISSLQGFMDGFAPGEGFFSGDAAEGMGQQFELLDGAFDGLLAGATDLGVQFQAGAQQTDQNLSGMEGAFGTALSGLASLGMVFGGIQQISKGGTGNVLSGIGGVMAGIGSAFLGPLGGMFGGGGAAPPVPGVPIPGRATGGGGNAGSRLLVGEWGPEVIDMPANGMVHNHNQLRSLMGGSGGKSEASMKLAMQFQTTRFMDRDWVDREQLEEAAARAEANGAREGERRGAERALDRIRQDPRTRRDLGIPY